MRTLFISILMTFAFTAQAQQSTAPKSSGPKPIMSSEGFRMSLLKMKSSTVMKAPQADGLQRFEESTDFSGVSMGYAYIPVNQVGCVFNLSYLTNDNSNFYAITRFDLSLASGFTTRFSGKIGLNGSVQTFKDRIEGGSPVADAGMNVGFGFELNKALGLDLTYMSMKQRVESKASTVFFQHQGMELALRATF